MDEHDENKAGADLFQNLNGSKWRLFDFEEAQPLKDGTFFLSESL